MKRAVDKVSYNEPAIIKIKSGNTKYEIHHARGSLSSFDKYILGCLLSKLIEIDTHAKELKTTREDLMKSIYPNNQNDEMEFERFMESIRRLSGTSIHFTNKNLEGGFGLINSFIYWHESHEIYIKFGDRYLSLLHGSHKALLPILGPIKEYKEETCPSKLS